MNATLSKPAQVPRKAVKPRPLMPLSAVMWRLNRDEDAVMAMIEEGELLWAFDVRTPEALRPSPRVLAHSITDYLAGRCPACDDEETEWGRVASLIFPARPMIVKCELAALLNCGRQHATDLIHARQFRLSPACRIRPGPGGSARIETASVKEWLRKRRML